MTPPDHGAFPIADSAGGAVKNLPNVTVAFPGEHWSDGKASEIIVPGELIVPINSGGKLFWARAASGSVDPRASVALRCVQIPDTNQGSAYGQPLGPNEIMNLPIQIGEYVHAYRSGSFHLTLVVPDATYHPSDLIAYDPLAARPTGKAGVGAWKKTGVAANALFHVKEWRPYSADGTEGVLTVDSLRGQF